MKINVPANTKTVSDEMLELKKKVEQGMTELKLSRSGLSKAIGHSRNYLSECLRVGVSTEKQNLIIGKIDDLLKPKEISIDVSDVEDEQHYSHWVGKAYHDQEVAKLKAEKLEIIQDVKDAEAYSQRLVKEKSDLQKANIDLIQEVKEMEGIKNAWRFSAWFTFAVLLVSAYMGVFK